MMHWYHHFGLSASDCFMHSPLESVTPHSFVTLEPHNLGQLSHPYVLEFSVQIKEVFR
jgi:hypothetical protein